MTVCSNILISCRVCGVQYRGHGQQVTTHVSGANTGAAF